MRNLLLRLRRKPQALSPPKGELASRRYLQAWGLDEVLTEKDDPELWATVLARYWPAPDKRRLNVGGLLFAVGKMENPQNKSPLEEFERSFREMYKYKFIGEGGDLWAIPEAQERMSQGEVSKLPPSYPLRTLQIDRPSKNVQSVLVDHMYTWGRLAARGGLEEWVYSYLAPTNAHLDAVTP